jgi:hypothetical protein
MFVPFTSGTQYQQYQFAKEATTWPSNNPFHARGVTGSLPRFIPDIAGSQDCRNQDVQACGMGQGKGEKFVARDSWHVPLQHFVCIDGMYLSSMIKFRFSNERLCLPLVKERSVL